MEAGDGVLPHLQTPRVEEMQRADDF